MIPSTTVAHLSDLHLSDPSGAGLRALLNKRLLAWLSWRRRRRHHHRPEILDAAVADLATHAPDRIVVSGDLTHLGLPAECRQVAAFLPRLGPPERVLVVPGNHDRTTAAPWADTLGLWAPWFFAGAGAPGSADPASGFPSRRDCGDLALIGVDSAVCSAPLLAVGRIGGAQLARLEASLIEAGRRGVFRIVVLHHPVLDTTVRGRKRLVDAAALRSLLARRGAEMVLHGHAHRATFGTLDAGGREIPVIGAPSATEFGRPGRHARWNLYRITRDGDGWEIAVTTRGYADGRFATEDERSLSVAAPRTAAESLSEP